MKHGKRHRGGDSNENSEDERIVEPPVNDVIGDNFEEEDDFFENSQELTQIVPIKSDERRNEEETPSPKKKKKNKKRREEIRESSMSPSPEPEFPLHNGYHVREMDVSEVPAHIISNMKKVLPKESDCSSELTIEAVQKAASSSKGGVWILKCPRDVSLSDLLPGKKLSVDGGQFDIDMDDDDAQLTQFLPTNSLGANIKNRQFEATTIVNDDYKGGAVLMLPDANKYKLVAAPIQGHIIIRECVKELQFPKIKTPVPKPRKLPEGIKERHPVYGADFTKIVDDMESAPKKKRKKSQDPSTNQDYVNGYVEAFPPLPAKIIPKIKIEVESDDSAHKTKKKKKKDRKDEDVVDNSFTHQNGYGKPSAFSNSLDENSSDTKNNSKKRKREEMEDSYHELEQTVSVEFSEPSSKKLKKSKRKSVV